MVRPRAIRSGGDVGGSARSGGCRRRRPTVNSLPPLRGTMFWRMPPAEKSAPAPLVWNTISSYRLRVRVGLRRAVAAHAVQLNAVERDDGLLAGHAVQLAAGLRHRAGAADVRRRHRHAGDQLAVGLRRPPGRNRVEQSRALSTCALAVLCTSTTGEAPETVTVSSSAPTRRSAFTVAVKSLGSSMPFTLDRAEAGQA